MLTGVILLIICGILLVFIFLFMIFHRHIFRYLFEHRVLELSIEY